MTRKEKIHLLVIDAESNPGKYSEIDGIFTPDMTKAEKYSHAYKYFTSLEYKELNFYYLIYSVCKTRVYN